MTFAGEVKGFDPTVAMDLKDARKADRYAQFAVCAAAEAMAQAAPGDVDPERAGVLIGSGIGGFQTFEEQHAKLIEKGPEPRLAHVHPDHDRRHGLGPAIRN